jgi:hypothetical protein
MKYHYLLVLLALMFPSIVSGADCSSLDTIGWVSGHWVSVSESNVTSETWHPLSDTSWEGSGETRDKESGELRSSESLRLVAMGGEVFYIAKVNHNEYPVAFKLTECSDSRARFANEGHDFPKQIDYLLPDEDDLRVQVSDGGEQGFEIRFNKSR